MNSHYRDHLSAGEKSLAIAYALLLLLGPLGMHRFYLGRYLSGFVMLLTSLAISVGMLKLVEIEFAWKFLSSSGGYRTVLYLVAPVWALSALDLLLLPAMMKSDNGSDPYGEWRYQGDDQGWTPEMTASYAVELHPSDHRV